MFVFEKHFFLVNGDPSLFQNLFAGLNFKGEEMWREMKRCMTSPWQGEAEIPVFPHRMCAGVCGMGQFGVFSAGFLSP